MKKYIHSLLFVTSLLTISCNKFKIEDIPQDSVPEEIIEEIIKEKYGIDIDLTPNSPEKEDDTNNK